MATNPGINISIDRGGTFCDVLVQVPGRDDFVFKLLSEDPQNYRDAPTEAIRRALEFIEGRQIPVGEQLDGSQIASCRIGTTIATNALLEGKGREFAFVTTKGFKDVCVIDDQTRPKLFALNVRKPPALHATSVEIDERITVEDYDLNPFPLDKTAKITDPALVRTPSGEVIRVLKALDSVEVREVLRRLRSAGYKSLVISFLHSYLYPDHENRVAQIAQEMGFETVIKASEVSPVIKFLQRSSSASSEAYLYPIVNDYVTAFQAGFSVLPQRVEFMGSDGGLRQADRFRGNEALLSGPAGGVVGIARTCFDAAEGTPVLGFDMGGTSTDVCRYDGKYDYLTETTVGGRKITAPMLNIATVAAGGGSMLFARHGLFVVGPESAGAHPGPACYRKGGPLTVTDANLFLGRLVRSSFPAIFGPNADQHLDLEITKRKFHDITREINEQTRQALTAEEVAFGFLDVANETMTRPMRNATEVRGFAPSSHTLVSFGGAGGQHACSIANKLGITRILIHKHSSLLSAVGISQADLQVENTVPFVGFFNFEGLDVVRAQIGKLKSQVESALLSQGADASTVVFEESLSLRYAGTDTNIVIPKPEGEDYGASFVATHLREFAFVLERKIHIDSIKVRGVGRSCILAETISPYAMLEQVKSQKDYLQSDQTQPVFFDKKWHNVPIFELGSFKRSCQVQGPALLIDATQTIFVEPLFDAYLLPNHLVLEKSQTGMSNAVTPQISGTIDPIQLSILSHRFMAIAEQMGHTLQRTSISTSIKERLDFSCAIFSREGKLVANAPHIPIHLGSMQYAIQYQHRLWEGKLKAGDVLLSNHPECGGTHLPDLTIITPVFVDDDSTVAFYVAARGHHTDIGGQGITSMMPDSKELWQEGFNVRSMKIVDAGVFLESDVRKAFLAAGDLPGCSPTRRLEDNISDIKAQISANQRGILLLQKMCAEFSFPFVHRYMNAIQMNSETAVREYLKKVSRTKAMPLTASDHFDDGTVLKVSISIDEAGGAVFDFAGTGPQIWGNYNCPISITHSAVIYSIRCLVDADIPLNDGCLSPIDIRIPIGSILRPTAAVAVCGSTLASQRIVDTILRAFECCAAFSGCANSFGWGMGGRDPATGIVEPGWNYGEAVGGGCGAGPSWNGEHAVQAHSTNTKITDAEVVEKRTPVIIRRHSINPNTGGAGTYKGGNGAVREIEARIPLKFSILSDRRVFAPYGMSGGQPGSVGKNYAFKWNDGKTALERLSLSGKAALTLQAGEIMQINSPGGGGWGASAEFVK
ncbi:5-oxoprolinase, putative [Penicillium digitatum]|uniref:5-oxoprolinase, putative n=3 Tax=Penicillium digitatum TaxID=36651 RepID=K9GAS9_PEND2|nr:5-oxoprolinase, putative [Penicillium digitatum Pd1]EKV19060.1 5-oxoprolinase, putative [Penicillium digitatum PHI26]EKV21070.1 5-oxoprolinase, putative [Penicillium digitatum Pd1]QQK48297.1 5-oxoprolinase, putative [Penicillium digitatum]